MTAETPVSEIMGLTVWGKHLSAQVREYHKLDGTKYIGNHLMLYFREDTPVSPEDHRPFEITPEDAILLRDLLNEATRRGDLPPSIVNAI